MGPHRRTVVPSRSDIQIFASAIKSLCSQVYTMQYYKWRHSSESPSSELLGYNKVTEVGVEHITKRYKNVKIVFLQER